MKKILFLLICSYQLFAQQQFPTDIIKTDRPITIDFKKLPRITNSDSLINTPPNESDEEMDKGIKNEVKTFVKTENSVTKSIPLPQPNNNKNNKINSTCPDFEATHINNSAPPDPNGAAGFEHLMVTVNNQVKMQQKNGTEITSVTLPTFWNGTGHSDIFDPKVVYDPYNHRWIFVCCASRESNNSALLLGVSQTYNPNDGWNLYSIDADGANNLWFDYPSIGFNKNWIVVSGNMFVVPNKSGSNTSRVWIINKNEAYQGNSLSVSQFDNSSYNTICPSLTYDNNENNMWCLSNHNSNSGGLGYYKIFNISGTAANPTFTVGNTIQIGAAWESSGVDGPQFGTTIKLNLGDHRIQNVVYKNGRLYYCQNVFLPAGNPTVCGIQHGAINPLNGNVFENYRIWDAANQVNMGAYPSITVNDDNDLAIGYCIFYPNIYPSAAFTLRRGLSGSFNSAVFKNGQEWYNRTFGGRNRWGDYTGTHTDPDDRRAIWIISQYAFGNNTNNSWGTWWKKICPDFCPESYSLGSNTTPLKYEATNQINSTSNIATGKLMKFDAGTKITLSPGFRANNGSYFKAYIDGCGGVK